jgi:hypothetical protein
MATDQNPHEDWDWEDETEQETALLDELPDDASLRLQTAMAMAINHPRLSLGTGSLLVSFALDIVVRFDPLVVILGLGAAVTIGFKAEDLMQAFVPGSDQEQARESADRFADHLLEDYPIHADHSVRAKLRRLFHLEESEVIEAPPRLKGESTKSLPAHNTGGEALTYERICIWLEHHIINDKQFFVLLQRLDEGPKNRDGNGYGTVDIDEHEEASEEAVSPQNEALRPSGWSEARELQLIGAFLATRHLDNSLKAIGLSTSQRNRDYARGHLKQQGLWEDK